MFTKELWVDQDVTEAQQRLTITTSDHVAEWGSWTFYGSRSTLCILRHGHGGYEVGWRFATLGAFQLSWHEIAHVARSLHGSCLGPTGSLPRC